MQTIPTLYQRLSATTLLAILCASIALPVSLFASGGATDPIPGTSKSGLKSGGGGGGGGGGKPTPVTPATPSQTILTGVLNFTAAASVNDVIPQ